jgi:hypothetical protein
MSIWPYIIPFAYLIFLESLTVRWVAGGPVPGLVSRVFAANLAGVALLLFISMTGWFFEWWPDIRDWALRDSFFLFLIIKAPIFSFLFRRWGFQRNFASVTVISLLFVYSPQVLGMHPLSVKDLDERARSRLLEIRDAVETYRLAHGYYPGYIWGGDMMSWGSSTAGRCPDPLLSEGYLPAYPVNPLNLRRTFFEPRREPGWRELWFGDKSVDFLHVRNLWQPVVESDPRFGYRGAKMGNVLPDPRFPETKLPYETRFAIQGRWLPGGFFYRSYDLDEDGYPDAYILGVCAEESAQATMDCYDARLDSLATLMGDRLVPSAWDGIRDGVIYKLHRGFTERFPSPEPQPIPRIELPIDPLTGEPIPQPIDLEEKEEEEPVEGASTARSDSSEDGEE